MNISYQYITVPAGTLIKFFTERVKVDDDSVKNTVYLGQLSIL